jgi:hypothetical protein
MSFASQGTQQKFPYAYNDVYKALLEAIPECKMEVKSSDKKIGRITASAGISLLSWGENIAIVVEKISAKSTLVAIESSLKAGFNYVGSHRHQQNFEKIIMKTSEILQK